MIVSVLFLLSTICAVFSRQAQADPQDSQTQQNQSAVDAARRSRELKKNSATPARVITNDDLESERAKRVQNQFNAGRSFTSIVNPAFPAEKPKQPASLANIDSESQGMESEEAAAEEAEIARLKARLASAQNSVFWQQRELLLDQNTIYTNPAYTNTHVGKARLDAAQSQIDEKQQEIERLKEPLANLEWRQWRRMQAGRSENGIAAEGYESVPPSALVLPPPLHGQR